jgi:hypothetical protein
MRDEWKVAILAFFDPPKGKEPNPKPLADLLRGDEPVPKTVRTVIAEAINPTLPNLGNWSLYTRHTGNFDKFMTRGLRDLGIFFEIEHAASTGERGAIERSKKKLEDLHKLGEKRIRQIRKAHREAWLGAGMKLPNREKN